MGRDRNDTQTFPYSDPTTTFTIIKLPQNNVHHVADSSKLTHIDMFCVTALKATVVSFQSSQYSSIAEQCILAKRNMRQDVT